MRYNITRLVNEIMSYERTIESLKGKYKSLPDERQEISRELNSKRHAKSLCYKYIGEETVARMKEKRSLDDTHELDSWEDS